MKHGTMILRVDGSFDFYATLNELHEKEQIKVVYQVFARNLRETGIYRADNGDVVYRGQIVRT